MAQFGTSGTFETANLLAGDFPRVHEKRTILSGSGVLAAGTVLAVDTGNNDKLVPVDSTAGDPGDSRRTPYAILIYPVDATEADVEGFVALSGHYNELALSFGGTDTLATTVDGESHRATMRRLGFYFGRNIPA